MLDKIAGDDSQKADARHEADTLSDSTDTLEFNLMLEVWNKVLQRFNMCSKILQAADIDLHTAVALLESLKTFITGVRDQFDEYETNAKTRTDVDYRFEQRARRRRLGADRLPIPSEVISGTENFKRNTFLPILDQLHVALTDRMNAYTTLHQRFSFLSTLDRGDLQQKCQTLCNAYPDDLPQGKELYLEVLQYADFFDQLCTVHTKKKDESTALRKYRLLYESGSASAFPNVEVCYRIYLCLMVTNFGGERSFSVLKRVKSACRATMRQERLQSLGLLCIESEILRSLNFDDIVQDFSNKKSRRHRVTSNCVVSS